MSDNFDTRPLTPSERQHLAECAQAAPLAEGAVGLMLGEYDRDQTVAVFAREAIADSDLTKADLAWLYAHAVLLLVDKGTELDAAHASLAGSAPESIAGRLARAQEVVKAARATAAAVRPTVARGWRADHTEALIAAVDAYDAVVTAGGVA